MSNMLGPDQALEADQSLWSANGRFTLVYQSDGNLVLYKAYSDRDARALWASHTDGRPVGRCLMQGDGNLVIYGPDGGYIWDSATHDNPGAYLIVQDDGNVVIYGPDNNYLWDTNTVSMPPPGPAPSGSYMQAGDVLTPNRSVTSANGQYTLVYQGDGNLVEYSGTQALWDSGTAGQSAGSCIMQGDGNLVIYDADGQWYWQSETAGNPGAYLVVQDDRNIVIYSSGNRPLWWTYDAPPPPPEKTSVPQLVGLREDKADAALEAAQLVPGVVWNPTGVYDTHRLRVVGQDPEANRRVLIGSRVNYSVQLAEENSGFSTVEVTNGHRDRLWVQLYTWDSYEGRWEDRGTLGWGDGVKLVLADGHTFTVVAVDTSLNGCTDGNPNNVSCQRLRWTGQGDSSGIDATLTII